MVSCADYSASNDGELRGMGRDVQDYDNDRGAAFADLDDDGSGSRRVGLQTRRDAPNTPAMALRNRSRRELVTNAHIRSLTGSGKLGGRP